MFPCGGPKKSNLGSVSDSPPAVDGMWESDPSLIAIFDWSNGVDCVRSAGYRALKLLIVSIHPLHS